MDDVVPARGDALPLIATDPRWLPIALDDLDAVHADHLHCERKAAQSALSLIRSYPERAELVTQMARLAHDETRDTLQSVVSGMLGPLLESDATTQSEYVKTLSAFLANDRHFEPTAKQLHVHVNTLRYRLSRIQDISGVDLHDVNRRFLLELALRIHAGLGG